MSRTLLIMVLGLGIGMLPVQACADHVMVLIASRDSSLVSVDPIDVRKLYLGFTVIGEDGLPIRALANASDPQLWETFLQGVMGMSKKSYDRRLLTLTLQSGRRRPDVYDDSEELLDRIERDKHAIAFIWEEDMTERGNVRIVRVLWQA